MKRVPGLYKYKDKRTGRTYYSCKHPLTGKRHGLGTDRTIAIRLLHRLHAECEIDKEQAIWNRLKRKSQSFRQLIEEKYTPTLKERELAETTIKNRMYIINNVLMPRFGDMGVKDITVKQIADILDDYKAQGKNRMAQNIRSVCIDIFTEAMSAGWTKENPAAMTRNPKASIKRSRLTLEQFLTLYELAKNKEPWVCRMMELAIITSHAGCTELSVMQRPVKGEEMMRIERTKTTERVKIPLKLTLDALGWNLGDVVKKCTSTGIASQYLLHHTTDRGNCGKGKKMHHYRLSRAFTELVRESNIDWADKLPATLYEVRSLSARLYEKQGIDIQKLMAHKDRRSTERYIDSRGSEWIILDI